MRLVLVYAMSLFMGFLIAGAIAFVVGLAMPSARLPVFLVIAAFWAWTGWRYATMRDRGVEMRRNPN